MSRIIRGVKNSYALRQVAPVIACFLLAAAISLAVVHDWNIAQTPKPDYIYRTVMLGPLGPAPMTEAAPDKATWEAPTNIYITRVVGGIRAKNGTVSACGIMLEKNSSNMLTSAIDCSTPGLVVGTLSTQPYSMAAGDKATVDIDTLTGGGNIYDAWVEFTYRTWIGSEAVATPTPPRAWVGAVPYTPQL